MSRCEFRGKKKRNLYLTQVLTSPSWTAKLHVKRSSTDSRNPEVSRYLGKIPMNSPERNVKRKKSNWDAEGMKWEAGNTVENKSYLTPVTLVPTFSIANQIFWWLNQIFQRSCPLTSQKEKKMNLLREVWNTNGWIEGQMLIGRYYRRLADSETVFHKTKKQKQNKISSIETEKIFGRIRRSKDLFSACSCPYQINLDYLFNNI